MSVSIVPTLDMERVEAWMLSRNLIKAAPAYEDVVFP